MGILINEAKAIVEILGSLDQLSIDVFLASNDLPRIHEFSSAAGSSPVIALQFIAWVKANDHRLRAVFSALVDTYPNAPQSPIFRAGVQRLGSGKKDGGILHPWEETLVHGVPVVNRGALRFHLRALVGGSDSSPVMMIDGPPGTGRSHSWHLIRHVAQNASVRATFLDLESFAVETRSLTTFFDILSRRVGLKGVVPPSDLGQAMESVAGLFAAEFCGEWELQQPDPIWIVVDGLDRDMPPELRSFICHLSSKVLRREADKIVLFLLGAGKDFGVYERSRRPMHEVLSSFEVEEVSLAARSVNAWGAGALDEVTLNSRIDAMVACLTSSASARDACGAVNELLMDLSEEVTGT